MALVLLKNVYGHRIGERLRLGVFFFVSIIFYYMIRYALDEFHTKD